MAEKVSKKILHLIFLSDDGKKATIRIPDPKSDLTSEQVLFAMNKVVDTKIFGAWRTKKVDGAKIVETITDQIDVEVDFI